MDNLKLGFLGLGQRGNGLLGNILHNFPDIDVVAVCDSYPDRTEAAAKRVAVLPEIVLGLALVMSLTAVKH